MVAGALVGALGVYAFQLVGGRVLGEVEFTPIANLWTVQFLVVTIVLFPIEQLTIRRLAMQPEHPLRHDLPLIAGAVGTTALVISAALYLWRDEFLNGEAVHALQAGLLIAGYGLFAFGRGRLAGMLDYRHYGFTTAAESTVRLTLGIALLAAGAASVGLAWSMVAAPFVILAWQPFRHISSRDEHISIDKAGGFLGSYVVANGASNIILAAGPLVADALGASNAVVSQYFFTLILLRAPFTFAYSLVARVLAPMARLVSEGRSRELSRFVGTLLAAGAALSVVGGLVGRVFGPWLVALLFGEEFRPRELVAALIVAGIGAAFSSLVLTQILVARGHTGRLAVAWMAALAAATAAIALAGGQADVRVAIGFVAGQSVALVGLAVATLRTGTPVATTELLK
jgi:O-antigen/teichoic acid export membrane protein